jgi:chromosome segregation ATPase
MSPNIQSVTTFDEIKLYLNETLKASLVEFRKDIDDKAQDRWNLYDEKLGHLKSSLDSLLASHVKFDNKIKDVENKLADLNINFIKLTGEVEKIAKFLGSKDFSCVEHRGKIKALEDRVDWMYKIVVSAIIGVILFGVLRTTFSFIGEYSDIREQNRIHRILTNRANPGS